MLGCWIAAGDEAVTASPLDGIREAVGRRAKVIFAKGCEINRSRKKWLDEAMQAAGEADVVILVLGESWQMSGEAASRTNIRLPKCQRKLAKAILKTGKPCVLVTMSGRPLDLSWEDRKFPAILHAWALGTEGGRALADILFGDAAPVGKLTMGFPRSVGQLPMTYREKPTGRPFDDARPVFLQVSRCAERRALPLRPRADLREIPLWHADRGFGGNETGRQRHDFHRDHQSERASGDGDDATLSAGSGRVG